MPAGEAGRAVFYGFDGFKKAGLKELWTLKWHRKFDTCEIWTVCGGARPDDWPEWMLSFKDY